MENNEHRYTRINNMNTHESIPNHLQAPHKADEVDLIMNPPEPLFAVWEIEDGWKKGKYASRIIEIGDADCYGVWCHYSQDMIPKNTAVIVKEYEIDIPKCPHCNTYTDAPVEDCWLFDWLKNEGGDNE